MPNEELFSGIPSLGDEEGMQSYITNSTLASVGFGNDNTPAALQQTTAQPQTQVTPVDTEPATPTAPSFTAEDVARIVERNRQLEAHIANNVPQRNPQMQQPASYTPQQAAIIKQLIDRGVPLERINEALRGRSASNAAQNAMMQRLHAVESYLQRQEYETAQNDFIDRMTAFGDRFGLSENDLVTFGNKAMSMGINITTIPAESIETVFRAVYPDQYAIRSQRIAGAAASQIYGGSSVVEAPRATNSRMEDAYVEAFLKQSMPNQYGTYTK